MLFITLATFIATAAGDAWRDIAEWFKNLYQWFIDSGLARDTAEAIGNIITYIDEELIPLMWDYIHKIFGVTL